MQHMASTPTSIVKRLIITLIVVVSAIQTGYSQDPEFSQFYANPLYLNPAFAGSVICPRMVLNYRNQWPSISGAFVTYNASYDQHFDKLGGGIGILATSDRQGEGIFATNSFSGIYSYRLEVSREFSIKAALQATFVNRGINWDKLTFGDQIDPKFGFVRNTNDIRPAKDSKNYVDFSTGVIGYSENFYAGVAVHHLTQPDEGFVSISKLPIKLTAHAGAMIDLQRKHRRVRAKEDAVFSPNILYQQQQNFHQLNYGFYVTKYPFVGGVWYRQNFENSDALIFLFGLQYNSYKVGYSYDLTVSKLTNITGGAHEISFTMQFPCPPKKKRIRTINCPAF